MTLWEWSHVGGKGWAESGSKLATLCVWGGCPVRSRPSTGWLAAAIGGSGHGCCPLHGPSTCARIGPCERTTCGPYQTTSFHLPVGVVCGWPACGRVPWASTGCLRIWTIHMVAIPEGQSELTLDLSWAFFKKIKGFAKMWCLLSLTCYAVPLYKKFQGVLVLMKLSNLHCRWPSWITEVCAILIQKFEAELLTFSPDL